MQIPTAIIVGSVLLSGCVLANLGYSISRDMNSRAEQEHRARAEADRYLKVRTKEVWKQALSGLDVDFRKWLAARMNRQHVNYEFMSAKSFNLSDVQWKDTQHASVHGSVLVNFGQSGKDSSVFSWTRDISESGDGVDTWWNRSDLAFEYLPKTDPEKFLGFVIDISGPYPFRSPLMQ